jgi:peptide/nickel transport system substrate-binding protein
MRRRIRYFTALYLPLVLLVSACGGGSQPAKPSAVDAKSGYTAAQPAPATPGKAQPGGTLVMVTPQKPAHLDPTVHSSRFTTMINFNTHDPLVWQVKPNVYAPGLAERWEISADFRVYTFYLRKDVTFHDGTPFNAEAVKFTWDRIMDPATRSLRSPELGTYDKSEVVDSHTVRVTFKNPYPTFLAVAANVGVSPQSPTAVQRLGAAYLKTPSGTGPFKVDSWPNENTLVLVKNPDYKWGPSHLANQGAPYLDKIIFKFVTEEVTRTAALERSEAHVAEDPARQMYQTFKSDPKYQALLFKTSGLPQHWAFNLTRYPTNDPAVRQAVLHGLNLQAIADTVFFGTVTPAKGPLADSNWAYWPGSADYNKYDPKKSVALLEAAGYKRNPTTQIFEKNGKPVKMTLVTTSTSDQMRAGEMAQAQLKEIGIDFQVDSMVYDATVDRYVKNEYELGRLGLSSFDPDVLWRAFHSSQIKGGSQFNRSQVADPALDALLDKGRSLVDPKERIKVYEDIQKFVLDNSLAIFVWEDHYLFAGLSCVKGWTWEMGGNYLFHNVWLEGACRNIKG